MDKKKFYEKTVGRKISYRTWERVLALSTKYDFNLSRENLIILGKLKKEAITHKVPLEMLLKAYTESLFSPIPSLTGKDLLENLKQIIKGQEPHRTTLIRWLSPYSRERIYTTSEINIALLHATVFKLRNQNNATNQSTNRSRSLSTKKA